MKAWDVILEEDGSDRIIDTVFYLGSSDAWEVWHGLINHDGYDSRITVRCEATAEEWPESA